MKIAIVAGNGGSGGLIGYIKGILSEDVVPDNCVVKFFCGKKLAKIINKIAPNIEICTKDYLFEKGSAIVFEKKLHNKLIKEIDNFNPDVVFFTNGYIRKGLEHYPNIMVLHNQLYIDKKQFWRQKLSLFLIKLLLFRRLVLRSMKKSNGVVFLSEFSYRQTIKNKCIFNNSIVIPFGFEEENRIDKINIKPIGKPIKFLYISSIMPYKNQIELLKAFVKLNKENLDFELHFCGDAINSTLKELDKIIRKNNLYKKIIFHKCVEHEKIKDLIDLMDIFVYASSIETTGYGLLEGMARGAVIISSNKSGFTEILGDGGIYFDPENIDSICNAVRTIISDEKLRKKCTKIAFERSKLHTWGKAATDLYKYLLRFANKN